MGLRREQIAWRAAQDLPDGAYVNLGIGLPTLVVDHCPQARALLFHSENGLLGMGPRPPPGRADPDLTNAAKDPVTIRPGGSYFDQAESFAMIRGGRIDLALLGAFEVSAQGDLANWSLGRPDEPPAVGGAIDLAFGAREVRALMEHTTREGRARLVASCRYPLTARGVVRRVYTDLAVLDLARGCFVVREMVEGLDRAELQARTAAPLRFAPDVRPLQAPPLRSQENLP